MGFVSSLDVDVIMTAQQITDFKNNFFNIHVSEGLVAFSGGGQGSATLINALINEVDTVASPGDSVKLPIASEGLEVIVINNGANSLDIFPNTDDEINSLGINTAFPIATGSRFIFITYNSTNWVTF